jgi:hypothetical protein
VSDQVSYPYKTTGLNNRQHIYPRYMLLQRPHSHCEAASHSGYQHGSCGFYHDTDRSHDVGKSVTGTYRKREACADRET